MLSAMNEQGNPTLQTSLASGQAYGNLEAAPESVPEKIIGRFKPDEHLVSLVSPNTMQAEQYRTLSVILEHRRQNGLFQVVAISSPTVGDGKTVTAINLASAFAQSTEARVLLIDIDIRKPSIQTKLGMRESRMIGLLDAIVNPALSLKDIVHHLPQWNLSVVTIGRAEVMPHEVFRSARFTELIDEARRDFDWVILDTAPLVLAPDCVTIGRYVDGFVMVVCAHKTLRKEVGEALDVLGPSKLVGLVFNSDDELLNSYKYGPYFLPHQ